MQRLLVAPKPPEVEDPTPIAVPQEMTELPQAEALVQPEIPIPPKNDGLTTDERTNKRIPVPEHKEKPEPKKRGFLSRIFLPYG